MVYEWDGNVLRYSWESPDLLPAFIACLVLLLCRAEAAQVSLLNGKSFHIATVYFVFEYITHVWANGEKVRDGIRTAQHTDSRVNYLAHSEMRRKKTSPIKFNKCYIRMIDHSINLYFQINSLHNVSAPMSFHFLCFSPLSRRCYFVYALFVPLYV